MHQDQIEASTLSDSEGDSVYYTDGTQSCYGSDNESDIETHAGGDHREGEQMEVDSNIGVATRVEHVVVPPIRFRGLQSPIDGPDTDSDAEMNHMEVPDDTRVGQAEYGG